MHDPRIGVGGFGAGGGRRCRRRGGSGRWPQAPADLVWRQLHRDGPARARPTAAAGHEPLRADRSGAARHAAHRDRPDRPNAAASSRSTSWTSSPTRCRSRVICEQLGVPHEDEPRFHPWAEAIITALDPRPGQQDAAAQASAEMNQYMAGLVERFRAEPGTGLLSGLAAEEGLSTAGRRGHRETAADRGPRDHRQPHRQRHAYAAASSRRPGTATPRARAGDPARRGVAALRAAGADQSEVHDPGRRRGGGRHDPEGLAHHPRAGRRQPRPEPVPRSRPVRPGAGGQRAPRLLHRHPLLLRRRTRPVRRRRSH